MTDNSADTPSAVDLPRKLPHTERGRKTRAALLRAARTVFARDGFLAATTTTIAQAAGVANGSFYTHFSDKYEILVDLWAEVQEEMLHPGIHHVHLGESDPAQVIEEATRAYLESYRANADLMGVFEQVATVDERFRALRVLRAKAFEERNERSIRRLQAEGWADPDLDSVLTADALNAMVSRTAYLTFCLSHREVDMDTLVATLTTLWINALRGGRAPATGADAHGHGRPGGTLTDELRRLADRHVSALEHAVEEARAVRDELS